MKRALFVTGNFKKLTKGFSVAASQQGNLISASFIKVALHFWHLPFPNKIPRALARIRKSISTSTRADGHKPGSLAKYPLFQLEKSWKAINYSKLGSSQAKPGPGVQTSVPQPDSSGCLCSVETWPAAQYYDRSNGSACSEIRPPRALEII